jgi:hypothetical protein
MLPQLRLVGQRIRVQSSFLLSGGVFALEQRMFPTPEE